MVYTIVQYIGMQVEYTHYRREAVDAEYEVLCNGQMFEQDRDAQSKREHRHRKICSFSAEQSHRARSEWVNFFRSPSIQIKGTVCRNSIELDEI